MDLTKKERVLNTFDYKDIDRPVIYDVIHNIKLGGYPLSSSYATMMVNFSKFVEESWSLKWY